MWSKLFTFIGAVELITILNIVYNATTKKFYITAAAGDRPDLSSNNDHICY